MSKRISKFVPENGRVLDLGCGNGELLSQLVDEKHISGYGVELNFECVKACIERGISVFHGDLNEGLTGFADDTFDVVILSQTLQQVQQPLFVISEMLRVGKRAIITFPNFAHWSVRLALIFGRIPKTKSLPYEWYDTPNIRVASIDNFRMLCKRHGYRIVNRGFFLSNLFSRRAFFVIERNP